MKLLLLVTFVALAEFDYKRRSALSCPNLCSCSTEFSSAEVVCSKGGLTGFPKSGLPPNTTIFISAALLHKLPLLQTLDLDGNNLQELPADVFRSLRHLETLNLAGNKLMTLKPQIFAHNLKLQQLEFLLLNQNQLRHLPTGLLDGVNPSLQIMLTGNPWECDGKMEYLWKWLTNHRQNVPFEAEMTDNNLKENPKTNISKSTSTRRKCLFFYLLHCSFFPFIIDISLVTLTFPRSAKATIRKALVRLIKSFPQGG
uniref:LRRCT domain-containing protein n=1 Tax=Fundulus heteroclitus TaxID=8078 RepID=A0A3Q2PZ11_FUNHE